MNWNLGLFRDSKRLYERACKVDKVEVILRVLCIIRPRYAVYPKRDPNFFAFCNFPRKGLESYNPRHGPNGVILCNPGFSRLPEISGFKMFWIQCYSRNSSDCVDKGFKHGP